MNLIKKFGLKIFFFLPLLVLGINTVVYSEFLSTKVGLSELGLILGSFSGLTLIRILKRCQKKDLNRIFVLSSSGYVITTGVYLLMYYLDQKLFENFVFSAVHLHPAQFAWFSPYLLTTTLVLLPQKIWAKYHKGIHFLVPLALSLVGLVLRLAHKEHYFTLIAEDSLIEYITVLASLVLVWFGFKSLLETFRQQQLNLKLKFIQTVFCLIAILAGIFIAGEEISWRQRLLGLEAPESLEETNLQGEINFHNLPVVFDYFDYISLYGGIYGAFVWVIFRAIKATGRLSNSLLETVRLWVPPWYLTFWFWLTPIFILLRFRHGIWAWTELGEPGEMYLMIGLALTWIRNYQQLVNHD